MFKKGRKKGTVRFSVTPANGVKKVCLAGDFNDWEPVTMRKQKNGSYAVTVPIEPGSHQYKFKLDDQWLLDPENHTHSANSFGTLNSVAVVE